MNQERWQKIEELYISALDIPVADRVKFLSENCEDAEIRNEVESLLSQTEEEDSFLGKPYLSLGITILAQKADKSLENEQIGHYKISKLLGKGGMGEVYLAKDLKLNRSVAVKFLPLYLADDDESVNRFQKEARASSVISHPNIAHIYEAGIEGNRRFIAMEYVDGITLRSLLNKQRIDPITALDIVIQSGNALIAAHQTGIIHRDVKPENIMIRHDGYVKVLDFGVAKLISDEQNQNETITQIYSNSETAPGLVMGTINYASPEQIKGNKVDYRTDIWSLGVVLFEVLTGAKLFEKEDSNGTVTKIIKAKLPLASQILTELKDDEELKQILSKVLQKNPKNRYQSVEEFINELKKLKQNLEFNQQFSTQSAKSGSLTLFDNQLRQTNRSAFWLNSKKYWMQQSLPQKAFISLVLIGIITFILGISANYLLKQNTLSHPKIEFMAIMPFDNETGDENMNFLTIGLAEDLISNLGRANNFQVLAINSAKKMKEQKPDFQKIRETLHTDSLLEGSVKRNDNQLEVKIRLVDLKSEKITWEDRFTTPDSDLLKLRNGLVLLISSKLQTTLGLGQTLSFNEYPTGNSEAYRLFLEAKFGRNEKTVDELKRLAANLEKAISLDPKFTLAYVELAQNYNLLGTFMGQKPEYYQQKASLTLKKALDLDPNLSEAHTVLAKMKMDFEHDWAGCEREFKRAIEINPNNELAHHWYGEVYLSAMNRIEESLTELEISHRLNPLSSGIVTALAWSYIGKKDYQKAIDLCDQAHQLNPTDNDVYHYRAQALFKLNRFEEAVQQMDEAIKIDGETTRYFALKAVFLASDGKRDEAAKILNELKHKSVSRYSLAIVENAIGNRDQAFELLNQELQTESVDLLSIEIDPLLDSMRDDVRFKELEGKLKFP